VKTQGKVILGAGLGALALLVISKVAKAAPSGPPSDGFMISLANPPAGGTLYVMNLGAESFNFSPMASSPGNPPLGVADPWIYQGLYKGAPEWQVSVVITLTIVDNDHNLVLQQTSGLVTIQNGRSYIFDCETGTISIVAVPWSFSLPLYTIKDKTATTKEVSVSTDIINTSESTVSKQVYVCYQEVVNGGSQVIRKTIAENLQINPGQTIHWSAKSFILYIGRTFNVWVEDSEGEKSELIQVYTG
jgi:hypothetical protein